MPDIYHENILEAQALTSTSSTELDSIKQGSLTQRDSRAKIKFVNYVLKINLFEKIRKKIPSFLSNLHFF